MKKVIFLSAAASLSMAVQPTPEQLQKWFREGAIALRNDDASDDTFYWVQNDNGRRWADDEQDNELFGGGDFGFGFRRDDEHDDEFIAKKKHQKHQPAQQGDDQGEQSAQPPKHKKKGGKGGKFRPLPQPIQPVQPEAEVQDNNLVMNSIKNGYYTASNWVLANPYKINQAVNFGANMLTYPKWDDEDDQLMIRRKPHKPSQQDDQGEQSAQPTQPPKHKKGGKGKGGKFRPLPQPIQPVQPVQPEAEVQDNNLVMNSIKNGYYTASNWVLANPYKINQAVNFGANMLTYPKWDDELMVRQQIQEIQAADDALFELGSLLEDAEN